MHSRPPLDPAARSHGSNGFVPVRETRADRLQIGDVVSVSGLHWTVTNLHPQPADRAVLVVLRTKTGKTRHITRKVGQPFPVVLTDSPDKV